MLLPLIGIAACGARTQLEPLDPNTHTPLPTGSMRDASAIDGADGGAPDDDARVPDPRDAAIDAPWIPPPLDGGAPVPVDPGPRRQVVSAGWRHTCAIAAGDVLCWGHNYSGQLGDGTNQDRDAPVRVVGLSEPMIEVSAGMQHTCARSLRGEIFCWGANLLGQLGRTLARERSEVPVQVPGITGALGVTAAGQHTCALLRDGTASCWGHGSFGQLGDGARAISFSPVRVAGLDRVMQLEAGWRHTCALRADGDVWCWGYNRDGQLGVAIGESAVPVQVQALGRAVQISAGTLHGCALLEHGGVSCWVGLARVDPIGGARDVVQVSASERTETCVARADGSIACARIDADCGGACARFEGLGALRVSTGFEHGCASVRAGIACWGSDEFGQLGDGPGIARESPVLVRAW